MNCERCRTELEDFLYGELSAARTAAIRQHLTGCADCRTARDTLERENEIFAEFYEQTALDPAPEMWEAIRSRIAAEAPAAEPRAGLLARLGEWLSVERLLASAMLRQVAFAALLVIISVAATTLYFTLKNNRSNDDNVARTTPPPQPAPEQPKTTPTPAPDSARPEPDSVRPEVASVPKGSVTKSPRSVQAKFSEKPNAPLAGTANEDELIQRQVARAVREYQGAVVLLERKIERRRDSLDPAVVAQYEKSIDLINRSIAESRRTLRDRPNDPAAGQYLLAAYAKKVELMQEIALQ
ncbi:MAG: zf-HC2 domain-containing protein [Blastocatellia bacterium]